MSEEMVINPAAEAEEEERLHEQVKVRRDKLAALCEAGKTPTRSPSMTGIPKPRRSGSASRSWRARPSALPAA